MKLFIDDREVEGREGETIFKLAQRYRIEIPHICFDERLAPTGSCRLCSVEVRGVDNLVTSCAYPIREGMEVYTKNERVKRARKKILELMLSNHPLDCLTCEKGGDCLLQKYAYELGISSSPYAGEKIQSVQIKNPFFTLDREKCVLCSRCISVCNEVQICNVLGYENRGFSTVISTPFDKDFKKSGCVFCGNCLSVCPTGALVENERAGKGRAWELKKTRTICPYCGVGCSIVLHTKDNRIIRVTSPEDSPNEGWLCVKGRFGLDFVNSDERLKMPLIRKDGVLREATWDEALDYMASRLKEIRDEYGSDAVGGFASAKCTNEENYLFQKFMRRAIGTNNVDHCARLCHAPTIIGLAKALGSGAMTNTIEELEEADCIFVVGSNTTETQPVTALRIKKAKSKGAKLIVADPRKTELAEIADVWLRLRNGSDTALINGIMCVILRNGWKNKEFIDQRTEGFEALREYLKSISMEEIERITGISMGEMERVAELYANSRRSSIVYCMGITQHICGTDNVLALADLAMLCGQIGREGCGINPLRGQCNVQGACDFGALPEFFTGYQRTDDEKAIKKFESAWSAKLTRTRGLTIEEMLHSAEEGSLKALYVMGENPVLSDPNSGRTIKALKSLDFLAVQDIFLTETAELADVVLPAACFAEKEGTFTNTERRVQRIRKAIEPPGIAKTDLDIICELSRRMGYPMSFDSPEKVMEEMASLTPSYGGISYERLERESLQWPCPSDEHPGTKYLHKDTFSRGKGQFYAVRYKAPAEMPDDEYPFLLSTGRVLYHFHTGTMSRKSRGINEVFPEAVVEINSKDADSLGLNEHETVRITSRRGSVNVKAMITDRVPKGEIFMPFHFSESAANVLTNDALDMEAKTPEYKIAAVRIERMSETYNNLQGDDVDAVT